MATEADIKAWERKNKANEEYRNKSPRSNPKDKLAVHPSYPEYGERWISKNGGLVGGPAPYYDLGPRPEIEERVQNATTTKKGPRKAKKPEVQFDEQAFLLDNIARLKNWDAKGDEPYKYKHFLQLHDNDPRITLNKLSGMGLDALNEVTTAQLSGLVPHLRLFKTITEGKKTTNIEFPFDKFTTMDSITSSREGRGTAAGIMQIDWKDTGGQPATQGKSFTGKLKLHFQSLEAIFMPMDIGGQKIAYSDLMEQRGSDPRNFDPAGLVVDGPEGGETYMGHTLQSKVSDAQRKKQVDPTGVCDESNTSIVLEAGWSVASSKMLNLTEDDLDIALYNMRRRFILTIWKSEVMVTENGDVDVVLNFYGAIEGMALSTHSDILNLDETNLESQPENVQDQLLKMKEEERKIAKSLEAEAEITKKQEEGNKRLSRRDRQAINREKRHREKYEKAFKTAESKVDSLAYGNIMQLIRSSIATKGANGQSRVFYEDISPQHLRLYTQLLKIQAKKYKFKEGSTQEEEKKAIEEYEKNRLDKIHQILDEAETTKKEGVNSTFYNLAASDPSGKDNIKNLKKLVKKKRGIMTEQGYVRKIGGHLRIQYVFLGDIIEAVMSIIYERRKLVGNKVGSKGDVCTFLRKRLKVMLGSIALPDSWNPDKIHLLALSDIPISVNYFNAWWYDNVVGQNRKHYMLLNFLQDLCDKLINNAMSPDRYGGAPGPSPIFSHQTLTLRDGNPLDNEWSGNTGGAGFNRRGPKKRIDIDEMLPGGILNRTKGRQNVFSQWLYVYASGQPNVIRKESKWQPRGLADVDKKQNIPHFMVGADKGMVQNIKFNRNKLAGQLEVSLERRSKRDGSKRIRANLLYMDMYNAQIKLFGNPAFKIGQMIYLDPRSLGVTAGHKTATLNIGGYYRVTQISNATSPDMFETDLKAIQEIGIRQIREMRLQDKMDGVPQNAHSEGT